MSSKSQRKRGAQPGNRNASKANRDARSTANPKPNPISIPENIDQLLDLEVRVLSRLMARLERQVQQTEDQDVSEEQTANTIRAVHFATSGTLRILRAKQLNAALGEDEFSRRLNQALAELNEETEAEIDRSKAAQESGGPPFPFPTSFPSFAG